MKFLFITEDHCTYTKSSYLTADLECCDDGILSIIDITDPENVREYYNGEWVAVEDRK